MKSERFFKYLLCIFILMVFTNCMRIKKSEMGLNLKLTSKSLSKSLSKSQTKLKMTTKFCNPLCRECAENDNNYCTICQPGIILYQFNCWSKCPDGTYFDSQSNDCLPCSSECPVCWGPNNNMCGNIPGTFTKIVSLGNEIKKFLTNYTFTQRDIEQWIESLKIILSYNRDEKLISDINDIKFSDKEVYAENDEFIELPIGCYSKSDGVFIPVPAYVNSNKHLVNSHWVYKKGMWDGKRWVSQHFPALPKFIKERGESNKIYYENNGVWMYDQNKGWVWSQFNWKSRENLSVEDSLNLLNTIKIDVYNILIL